MTRLRPIFRRNYATPIEENHKHDKLLMELLYSYPEKADGASPYEIMGFKNRDVTTATLKKRFHQLARIYHPDSTTLDGCALCKRRFFTINEEEREGTSCLTAEVKATRFKKILAAYTLLKNPLSRSNFDDFQVGWNDNSEIFHRSANPNYHSPYDSYYQNMHPQYQRWNNRTGTWEDHWQRTASYEFTGDKNWQEGGETFSEQMYNNRKNIFISVTLFIAVYAALQATHAYMVDEYMGEDYPQTYSSDEVHEKCKKDLIDAHANFGLGLTKEDRINRFLWFRDISMALGLRDWNEVIDQLKGRKLLMHDASSGGAKIVGYKNTQMDDKKRLIHERMDAITESKVMKAHPGTSVTSTQELDSMEARGNKE